MLHLILSAYTINTKEREKIMFKTIYCNGKNIPADSIVETKIIEGFQAKGMKEYWSVKVVVKNRDNSTTEMEVFRGFMADAEYRANYIKSKINEQLMEFKKGS